MGNIPSQQRYIYEQEGAHIAMQLLQNPEVQHVVKSLGDFFRHHGDYIQHRRGRGRKKDKQERDERLFQQGQRQRNGSYVEDNGQRDRGYGKRGLNLNDNMDNGRREGGGRRQNSRNNHFRDLSPNDYHQPCHPCCYCHWPRPPRAPPEPPNQPPRGPHRGSREGHTRRRPPRLADTEDSADEQLFPGANRQPRHSGQNPEAGPGPTQSPRHSRRDRPSGMPPQAPPDGGSRNGGPYPHGGDRQGPPAADQERRQRRPRGRDHGDGAPRPPGAWDDGPGDETGSAGLGFPPGGGPDYLPGGPN